jgi:hypothetical protein|tara:strand:+ start:926 stop:1603 length:678 start_codon:yes stop_codon:yes gene_type:complete
MEADRDRTLRIEIPPAQFGKAAEDPEWTLLESSNGWSPLPGSLGIYWEGSIDLSGYARDYKTFYPAGGVVQEGPYSFEVGGSGSIVYYVVSSVPLNAETILFQLSSALAGPGFINLDAVAQLGFSASQNWETTIFAESQMLVTNQNIAPNPFGIQQRLERNQSGSLAPTAAEVLYCMKMVIPLAVDQTTIGIPASRIILPGSMNQEPELEYMMRLSRSVELANQV